jgi:hypothetical protein
MIETWWEFQRVIYALVSLQNLGQISSVVIVQFHFQKGVFFKTPQGLQKPG